MTPSGQAICLCMIVKNEAPVIGRCLDSVRPLIDHWIIVDTGSTDGTQTIVREHYRDVPGELVERPWRDFAHNRSEALALARPHGDYSLIIDADDAFEIPAGYRMSDLDADSYTVDIRDTAINYRRTQLVRSALSWRYLGVLHEFIACDEAKTTGHLPIVMLRNHDGARRRDPDTYRKDAAILEHALEIETDAFLRSRYTFYLAQSYRDSEQREKAVAIYLRRAEMGFWDQEVFCSLLYAGCAMEALGRDPDEVLAVYTRATAACPSRAEAAHAASRFCRVLGRNRQGYDVALPGKGLAAPADGLFVENWIYRYGLLDELAINAYWAGLHAESRDACLAMLAAGDLPTNYPPRVVANLRFALDGLSKSAGLASADGSVWTAPAMPAPNVARLSLAAGRAASGGLVSIITPTRDRPRFLRRAARFVRAQTDVDIEWLILDDSPERPVLPDLLAGENIDYEHSAARLSVGEKRNRLIEKARGDVIVQFDDDDYYAPGYVAAMLKALDERDADLVNLRGWYLYDMRSRFFGYWDLMMKVGPHYRCDASGVALLVLDERKAADFETNHLGFGFSYAFRKRVWEEVKFPHVDWNEDARFALEAQSRFVVDGVQDASGLCLHVLHPGSSSRCFPQYRLPAALAGTLFPTLDWPADESGSRSK